MNVQVTATVEYNCWLDEDKAKQVIEYAKENDCTLEEAVWELYTYCDTNFNLYEAGTESDFSTESIDCVELEEDEEELWEEQ